MTTVNLDRTHFQISRSAKYFDVRKLQAQTGQPKSTHGEVVLKELIDNALMLARVQVLIQLFISAC